ncbi:hypothetical protein C4J81_05290 [Deltaproteobacteria bacterium Smac51]|nr:hypothetical protein C4J81_05290 [Deltaproteobacteria bacterium Smac51]
MKRSDDNSSKSSAARRRGRLLAAACLSLVMASSAPQLQAQSSAGLFAPSAENNAGIFAPSPEFTPVMVAAASVPPSAASFAPAHAQEGSEQIEVLIEGDTPIRVRADEIESDLDNHRNLFIGNVTIIRGGETLTAERALWQDGTNSVELSGSVKITTSEFVALAERAVVNLDLHLAKIYNGRAFFPEQNYYISGELIERVGEKTIQIKNGQATTCDGPEPSWTITADSLTVTEGGYATASGVAFNSKYMPLFYTPYFLFPVKNERQSGFLTPSIANSSRDGFSIGLPFFWATGENHDLTFIPVWRSDRGFSSTIEGRYRTDNGRGDWAVSYLSDNKPQHFTFNNTGQNKDTKDRYWLRGQNDWQVGDWDLHLDVDLVSDPLYLAEFRNDIDGFMASRNTFSQDFGRTLNEYLDPLRTNTFYAQKVDYDTYFRGALSYTDNLYSYDNRDTVQRLPSLYYAIVSRPLPESWGLFDGLINTPRFSLDTRYDYFYRTSDKNSETDEKGHRFQVNPSLSWSSPVGGLATLSLTGDLNFTLYSADGYRPYYDSQDKRQAQHKNNYNRFEGEFEATLATTMSRVYGGGPGDSVATRHQITPTVSFNYVETPDQDEMPYWDTYDRRLSRRTVRYGLLNTFVSKTPLKDENGLDAGYDYFQFLKLGLWTSYEFADNLYWANNPRARYYTTDYFDRGAGPLEIDLEAYFNPYLSARILSAMDGRTAKFTSHDISLTLTDPRGDSLSVTYDYDSPTKAMGTREYQKYEELRGTLNINLTDEWSAGFYTRYDVQEGRNLESYASLRYQAQCYAVGLIYTDNENDRRVGLLVDLLGLGTTSGAPSGLNAPRMTY